MDQLVPRSYVRGYWPLPSVDPSGIAGAYTMLHVMATDEIFPGLTGSNHWQKKAITPQLLRTPLLSRVRLTDVSKLVTADVERTIVSVWRVGRIITGKISPRLHLQKVSKILCATQNARTHGRARVNPNGKLFSLF